MPAEPDPKILDAIQAVSEKAALLVREEIELAKAEVELKAKSLVKGAVIGVAAGIFASIGMLYALHGLSWLVWYEWFPHNQFFWGFFVVAAVLFLMGALSGFLAAKLFKSSKNPAPTMAIEEAQKIKDTLTASTPEDTV